MKIVLATGNRDKVRELQVLFGDVPVDVSLRHGDRRERAHVAEVPEI